MIEFEPALKSLTDQGVEFVVVGGLAISAHSTGYITTDIDTLYGCEIRILTVEGLIKAKRAAGRVKDLLILPELEAIRELLTETSEE